jgi:hypothetical protein
MNTLALNISNLPIRQDSEGRYCLNDLHESSGKEQKHRPKYFLANQQAVDLIAEIEKGGITPILTKQGLGTYACKELVYAYAMWISPAFTLKVIHAYDSLVSTQYGLKQLPEPPTISKAQIGDLFNKVKVISSGSGKIRAELWSRFQNRYNLASYKDLPADKYDDAVLYLQVKQDEYLDGVEMLYLSSTELSEKIAEAAKVLAGELLPKEPATNSITITLAPLEHGKARCWIVNQSATEAVMLHAILPGSRMVSLEEAIIWARSEDYVVVKKDAVVAKLLA